MTNNEYCRTINALIPKYIKGQCTVGERALLEEHCARCPECRAKLTQAKDKAQTLPVKEILFLSRPKNLKTSHRPEGELKKRERAESISRKVVSRRTEDTDSGAVVIPEHKQIRRFIPLLIAAAVIIVIAFRSIPVLNQPDEPYPASTESTQVQKTEPEEMKSEEVASDFGEDFAIEWKDSTLESRMREITGITSGDIMYSDVKSITELDLSNGGDISDISALGYLTNLKKLHLFENSISDISVLSTLTNLTELSMFSNRISDISVLGNLTNLTELDLRNNQISDVSVLRNLTNLKSLYLSGNQIGDIEALGGLTHLEALYLDNNQISDISALAGLISLEWLDLNTNQISDISALRSLMNLEQLDLSSNQISDVSALGNLAYLYMLDLGSNQISDISALSSLTNLMDLNLSSNPISDISALNSLKSLSYLYLEDNQIADYSAIDQLEIENVFY